MSQGAIEYTLDSTGSAPSGSNALIKDVDVAHQPSDPDRSHRTF